MKDRPINNGSIKSANRLTVIRLIDELGTVSRAGIAEKIGMSKSSVSTIVEELINAGWIQEVGTASNQRGFHQYFSCLFQL